VEAAPLRVVFVGEEHDVDPCRTDGLVFGRGAALDVDSNPFLHRRVGRFVSDGRYWWVENLNGWTSINVASEGRRVMLQPHGRVALVHQHSVVQFEAGSCEYELHAHLAGVPELPPAEPGDLDDVTATFQPAELPLTEEQRLLVTALAERRLRHPHAEHRRLPSNQELAEPLGWTISKFNRKLDWLCEKLHRIGVSGLRGGSRRAVDRRDRLVQYMVDNGHVTPADLDLLEAHLASASRSPRGDVEATSGRCSD